jgi:uncharacterized protein (DUF1330 family)
MRVENAISPTAEQMKGFQEPGPVGPIFMLNLLKFKDRAEYQDGRETSLTGREAYALYSEVVGKLLVKHGGGRVFLGQVTRLMLGEVEDLWDIVGITRYPNRQAMLDMMMSSEYQDCAVHRAAGLAGQLNIETAAQPGFGR